MTSSIFGTAPAQERIKQSWRELGCNKRTIPSICNNVDVVLTYDLNQLAKISRKRDTTTAMGDVQVMLSTLAKVLNAQPEYETFTQDGTFLKGLTNVTLKEPLIPEETVALAMLIQTGTSDFLRILPNP